MKKILLSIFILCAFNIAIVKAQTSQGKVLVGISSTLSLAGTGTDLMTIGYSTTKFKSNSSGYKEPEPDVTLSLNLSPKIGYFVIDNLALGLDISFASSMSQDGEDKSKYKSSLYSFGPFVRYYIPSTKVIPFFEFNGSFGGINSKYESNGFDSDDKSLITTLGGGVGIAVPLSERVTFDAMAGYNSLTVKEKEDNPDNFRVNYGTIGLKFGFTVFLGSN